MCDTGGREETPRAEGKEKGGGRRRKTYKED